ncbi:MULTISPECIES: hypothetical protein [Halobacteriovorax]|uniref:DUF3784 domain-containing protein n=1 Tax=Halobacteriovorax vibrionivorans TaxID=2152716 RepID=A0ABY0IKU2_9BACT|nr:MULTISPECIES: hypothetical protein [Halobacteriovorax]RZF23104.1 hypothetical protein DAY19_04860 [Halobacteriovorax vibrionivorans]TGD49264.1 hypothetical protein EP118_00220 [Halobacteriovorax sp. Y22]
MELVLLTTTILFLLLGVVLGYPLFFKPKKSGGPFRKVHNETNIANSNIVPLKSVFKYAIVFLVLAMITVIITGAGNLEFYKEAYSILAGLATILILLIL